MYRQVRPQGTRPPPYQVRPQGTRPPQYQVRPQETRLPAPVLPDRYDRIVDGRELIIDPSGRAYFLNHDRRHFHWMARLGSDIIVAEHEGTKDFIDFSDDDASDANLYHYSEAAEKEMVRFDITSLSSNKNNAYDILQNELQRFYPNEPVEVKEIDRTPFCLDFQDGTVITDTRHHMDYMCVVRLDLKIQHKSWCLFFSVFEAHAPCACGVSNHQTMSMSCSRPPCRVATARTYEDFERLIGPIHLPHQDIIVYRHRTTGPKTIYEALLEGTRVVTAEEADENRDFNLDAYRRHRSLNTHPNFLSFHCHTVFHNRRYRLFSYYERTLFHVISLEKMEHISCFNQWVRDIVEGLIWLHNEGLYHGNVCPHNVVVLRSRALLHGLTRGGSQEDDIKCFGALLFHLFTRGSCFENGSYIPTLELCDEHLLKTNPEANDLVKGLISCRLTLYDVMVHPTFWMARKSLDFIKLVSDHVQAGQWSRNHEDRLLELALQRIEGDVYASISEPGSKGMSRAFLRHSVKYGVREFGSDRNVAALIRAFRNGYSHILDNSKGAQQMHHDSVSFMMTIRGAYPDLVLLLFKNLPQEFWKKREFRILLSGD